jgi:hypothetical protein
MHHSQVLLLLELPRRTRRASRAVIRELRGIFAAVLSEIFDGYFETALWIFHDARMFRRNRNGPDRIGVGLQPALTMTPITLRSSIEGLARGVFRVVLVS